MIRVSSALLVQLDELVEGRVGQCDGPDGRAARHDKDSRCSHDEPPKFDGERVHIKDKGWRSRR